METDHGACIKCMCLLILCVAAPNFTFIHLTADLTALWPTCSNDTYCMLGSCEDKCLREVKPDSRQCADVTILVAIATS